MINLKYNKTKILLPLEVYDDLKEYLRKNHTRFDRYEAQVTSKCYEIFLTITQSDSSASYKHNQVECAIDIYQIHKLIGNLNININKVSELLLIFEVDIDKDNKFLVNIDKETPNTFEYAKSKLNIMKWNIDNPKYIRNNVFYSNFSNERELMEVCYLLIANSSMLKNDRELKDFVYYKLNYYGYIRDHNKYYDLDIFDRLKNSKDVIEKATGRILYDILRFDNDGDCVIGTEEPDEELRETAFNMYENYIKKLEVEGKLSS